MNITCLDNFCKFFNDFSRKYSFLRLKKTFYAVFAMSQRDKKTAGILPAVLEVVDHNIVFSGASTWKRLGVALTNISTADLFSNSS